MKLADIQPGEGGGGGGGGGRGVTTYIKVKGIRGCAAGMGYVFTSSGIY